ncbi:MAG: ABC transporter permease [Candidatus Aminicenantia bacterium]
MINLNALYVLWIREMKRFMRSKSRVIGTMAMPVLFLIFLGFGFNRVNVPGISSETSYLNFLVPGIIGMSLLFTSTFTGLSVLWDREFGFLKEIMVAPVNRLSIALGRIAGGISTSLFQGIAILLFSFLIGFKIKGILPLLFSIIFMALVSATFVALGLGIASQIKDFHGFSLIMNFLIFPLFFLSGALYPVKNLPAIVRSLSFLDPLTYGVDVLRGFLIGKSFFPLFVDILLIIIFSISTVLISAFLFEKSEAV